MIKNNVNIIIGYVILLIYQYAIKITSNVYAYMMLGILVLGIILYLTKYKVEISRYKYKFLVAVGIYLCVNIFCLWQQPFTFEKMLIAINLLLFKNFAEEIFFRKYLYDKFRQKVTYQDINVQIIIGIAWSLIYVISRNGLYNFNGLALVTPILFNILLINLYKYTNTIWFGNVLRSTLEVLTIF